MGCFSCQKNFDESLFSMSVGRSETCSSCGSDIRCCLNCQYYEKNSEWECRENISEPVKDKERSNYCDFFRLKKDGQAIGNNENSKNDLLKAAEALFKK